MKLESISDIDELPSVLDVEEVNVRLIELIDILRNGNVDKVEGSEAINYLISYQGYNRTGLSIDASLVVLNWIKETYDPLNRQLVYWNSGNLANLTCPEAKEFIEFRLNREITEFEREELVGALSEIEVRT